MHAGVLAVIPRSAVGPAGGPRPSRLTHPRRGPPRRGGGTGTQTGGTSNVPGAGVLVVAAAQLLSTFSAPTSRQNAGPVAGARRWRRWRRADAGRRPCSVDSPGGVGPSSWRSSTGRKLAWQRRAPRRAGCRRSHEPGGPGGRRRDRRGGWGLGSRIACSTLHDGGSRWSQ